MGSSSGTVGNIFPGTGNAGAALLGVASSCFSDARRRAEKRREERGRGNVPSDESDAPEELKLCLRIPRRPEPHLPVAAALSAASDDTEAVPRSYSTRFNLGMDNVIPRKRDDLI